MLLALPVVVLLVTPALAAEVRLTDRGFSPRSTTVAAGEDIVWTNLSDAVQTIVGEDGTWDSGPLQPGETFTIALREPGTVRYATADGLREAEIHVTDPPDEDGPEDAADGTEPAGAPDDGVAEDADAVDGAVPEVDATATAVSEDGVDGSAALPDTGLPAAAAGVAAVVLLSAGLLALRLARVGRTPA